ncbi:10167_t:CDS:2, partial [Racocetra persica]
CAKKNGLKVYLMNESPNPLIYKKNTRISGRDMFVSLWSVLCEQKNRQNYGTYPQIKPFLLASARKRISEIVKPLRDQVKHIHTDGFIVVGKVELKTGIEMGKLKLEKREKPSYPEILNLTIFKENELHTTNSLLDFGKIQDKEQNTNKKETIKKIFAEPAVKHRRPVGFEEP